jgi:cell pole-organizing protein PopZ
MSGRCTRSDCAFLHDLPSVVISRHSSTSIPITGNDGKGSTENGDLEDSAEASVKRQRREEADSILLKFSVSQAGAAASKDVKLSAKLLKPGVVLPKSLLKSSSSSPGGMKDPQPQSNEICATVANAVRTVAATAAATEDEAVNQNHGQEDHIGEDNSPEIHDDTGFVPLE